MLGYTALVIYLILATKAPYIITELLATKAFQHIQALTMLLLVVAIVLKMLIKKTTIPPLYRRRSFPRQEI
jgi:hypothetical protein